MNYATAQNVLTHAATAVLYFSIAYTAIAALTHTWKRSSPAELITVEVEADPLPAATPPVSALRTFTPHSAPALPLAPAIIQPVSVEVAPKRKRGRPRKNAA